MQHIRRREKRVSSSFGDCEKDISEFEGNPTDSDPGYEVNKKKSTVPHNWQQMLFIENPHFM